MISDERTVSPLKYEIYNKPALPNSLDNGAAPPVSSAAGKTGLLLDAAVANAAVPGAGNATTAMAATQASDETGGNGLSGSVAAGGSGNNGQEVDEDGYSIQPPKEIILEANGNKDGKWISKFSYCYRKLCCFIETCQGFYEI